MLAALAACAAPWQEAARSPNVLFILFDKCRTDAIGPGERNVHTPQH
jgi:hypothetical protein